MFDQENVQTTHADLILKNGRIATQDDRRSFATAVAIKDGRFIAVGDEREILAYQDSHPWIE
jgi:predicted amidohydrolase YtcJ